MKKLLPLIALVPLAFLMGCGTTPTATKAYVKGAVIVGISIGVTLSPDAVPYLRDYAAPVVCEAAKGTNTSPEWVIEQLKKNEAAEAELKKSPIARALFNSAFGIFESLYYALDGADSVEKRPLVKAWLEGTCEGILEALPAPSTNALAIGSAKPLPPHLK